MKNTILIALLLCAGCKAQTHQPIERFDISMCTDFGDVVGPPFHSVWVSNKSFKLTNWMTYTNVTDGVTNAVWRLVPRNNPADVKPGQVWCFSEVTYQKVERVIVRPAWEGKFGNWPEHKSTNLWDEVGGHTITFKVLAIEGSYVKCEVQNNSETTACMHGITYPILRWFTNNVTFITD